MVHRTIMFMEYPLLEILSLVAYTIRLMQEFALEKLIRGGHLHMCVLYLRGRICIFCPRDNNLSRLVL